MNLAVIAPAPPARPEVLNTGIPFIGTIDLHNPIELAFLAAVVADLVFVRDATLKLGGVAALVVLRQMISKIPL